MAGINSAEPELMEKCVFLKYVLLYKKIVHTGNDCPACKYYTCKVL